MQEIAADTNNLTPLSKQNTNWWYRATPLNERISLQKNTTDSNSLASSHNSEKAKQRLQRWKEQAPFDKDDYFTQRLAMDALTEDELLVLLGEPVEAPWLDNVSPPSWFSELLIAFTNQHTSANINGSHSETGTDTQELAFLNTLRPLLMKEIARLQTRIQHLSQEYTTLPFDPHTVVSLLFAHIPALIFPKLIKTIVLELHVARVQGNLQGDTPEERFQTFLQQLSQPEKMLSLLEEYAVLARQLVEMLKIWINCEAELLERLCADWQEIQQLLLPDGDPGVLTEIQQEAGDTHRGGHNVTLLTWSSGFRLVYKPRSMMLDIHFQELLIWLNEHGQQPAFRTIRLIDRQTYGWSEFVIASDCTSHAELERFYQRQGGYLALLYVLEATDFHAENLIASSEHPVLIDLEALFQPRLPENDQQINPIDAIINRSVLRIGLLPQRIWAGEQTEGVDISGLGGYAGQLTPMPVPVWKETGTDQMRVARERVVMTPGKNQPKLNGQDINILEYSNSLANGFAATYRLLMQLRPELLAEILPRFARDQVRYILRPTRAYGMLLMESFHPNLLRDALDRDRFFDRLWLGIEQQPYLSRVIATERADLLAGDIPLFTTCPDSHVLVTSGGETLADFFEERGMDAVCKRIQQLDEQDLARQLWIIQASFTSLVLGTAQSPQLHLHPSQDNISCERLIHAARAVGDRLKQLAHQTKESIGWIGVDMVMDREWYLLPTSTDLYSGTTGITLFLAYLGAVTGEEHYTTLAKATLESTRTQMAWQKHNPIVASVGAFSGLGAYIYLLSHLGVVWNNSSLFREAEDIVKLLAEGIAQDEVFDVIAGSAGCIAALLSLYAVAPSQATLTTAIQCGDHLITHATAQQSGIGWSTQLQETPLTGLAHGNAGIALNLLRLFSVSGEERFRETAFAAMEYERSLYSLENRNWPDLRKELRSSTLQDQEKRQLETNAYMVAWCHGAPGIGLARLASLEYVDEPALHEEIDAAFQTTLTHGFGLNHCLCHGDMGNIEFVMSATRHDSLSRFEGQVQRLLSTLLDSIEKQGWVTGVPLGVETPGLMTGIAGTGYALLRAAFPERIPSLLLLAPPEGNRYA